MSEHQCSGKAGTEIFISAEVCCETKTAYTSHVKLPANLYSGKALKSPLQVKNWTELSLQNKPKETKKLQLSSFIFREIIEKPFFVATKIDWWLICLPNELSRLPSQFASSDVRGWLMRRAQFHWVKSLSTLSMNSSENKNEPRASYSSEFK